MGFLKIVEMFFGGVFTLIGVFLIFYDIYWLYRYASTPPTSSIIEGLGAGFAALFIIIGIVLLLVGAFLIYLSRKKKSKIEF